MFTGLVEAIGVLKGRYGQGAAGRLHVTPEHTLEDLKYGESIAVNGTCLTLEKELDNGELVFYTLEETLKRTNLGVLEIGSKVNLERAMKVGDRLGGHIVSGHVDCVGQVISCEQYGDDIEFRVYAPTELRPYLVEKGSVAIDGVSLTLVQVGEDFFTVHLIPVTLEDTALCERESGMPVNLEGDILGKYVEKQLALRMSGATDGVTMATLLEAGWQ
eukprot:TRINITY_DN59239_c0_g1_i1.p2 TRINITY_DN59239_c0_g1~~TRINITY_DN59239_c0_g1_i1.p2  ORF type:complete len:217 (+),score=57.98 TRINITY_DN59239_c0_g1_i1:516-1166(+)